MFRQRRAITILSLSTLLILAAQGRVRAQLGPQAPSAPNPATVIDLGQPGSSTAVAISNSGIVTGFATSQNGRKTWTWVSSNGAKPKKTKSFGSRAYLPGGVNDSGTIVGQVDLSKKNAPFNLRAFRGGKLLPAIPHPPTHAHQESASDINNAGTTVGFVFDVFNNVSTAVAVVWRGSGPPTVLPGIGNASGLARSINNAGDILGEFGPNSTPVLWRGGTALTVLPLLRAFDINDLGTIIGISTSGKAAILRGDKVTEIGPGIPNAINNQGQVIGTGGPLGLWIWDAAGGQRSINCLLPAGFSVSRVSAVNDSLQIVGSGQFGSTRDRAFLWNLTRSTGSSSCPVPAVSGTVEGTVEFDKVLVDDQGLRTDLFPVLTPAEGVAVELLDDATNAVVATTTTDSEGKYELHISPVPPRLRVRALADSAEATVVGMSGSVAYSVASPAFTLRPGTVLTQDLGISESGQASGPFNMVDALRRAAAFVRKADPSITIPKVTVRWAVGNTEGTHFRSATNEAFIKGDRATDSDEYDDGVILHEYAHFLTAIFSRSDSPNGNHGTNEQLDPRLAWNEGWADFFGVAAQDLTPPSSAYFDSLNPDPGGIFTFDVETNVPTGSVPGHWSEDSVSGTVWDVFDALSDTGDSVEEPWPQMWQAFRDLTQSRFNYLIDWADSISSIDPSINPGLQTILAERQITFTPGAHPSVPNPFPAPIASGVVVSDSVDSLSTSRVNMLESSDYYEFTLTAPGSVTIELEITGGTPGSNDLDLLLLDDLGSVLSQSVNNGAASESITSNLPAGAYVIQVRSFSTGASSGTTTYNAAPYKLTATY